MAFKFFRKNKSNKLEVMHLGGMGEIGKNMTLLKYGNNILIIDCGMKFPEEDMPGIDMLIPDMTYLKQNKDKVRGLVLTHGHEDHIGAIPYLLKEMNVPIWGTKLTLGLVEHRLKEHNLLTSAKLHPVKPKDIVNVGPFKIEFIRVCHSIADAVALAIKTPVGTVIHTGDYKIDYTPIDGQKMDLNRFGELGKEGVLLLMADSTNADLHGSTPSEKTVGDSFDRYFDYNKGRIIVALFASNVHRTQQIINAAEKFGKKIAISGMSMQNVVNTAKNLGYLDVHKDIFIKLDEIGKVPHNKLIILTTGSQGEPMAALSRMAKGEHKQIKIQKGDMVVISALPIPGNEKSVARTIDSLFKFGADVIYEERHGLHVSGHACQEDMKLLLNLIRPKYFIPVHGEYRHQVAHSKLALETGMKPENVFLNENGDSLIITRDKVQKGHRIKIDDVLVDGTGVGDIGTEVLAERRHLAEDGIIVISVNISRRDFRVISDIDIETRGFVFVNTKEDLLKKSKETVKNIFLRHQKQRARNLPNIKRDIQKELGKYLMKRTERRPVILPIIVQV